MEKEEGKRRRRRRRRIKGAFLKLSPLDILELEVVDQID